MSQTRLSLSWQAFKNNFCDGLSSLQQREEFVDMTLAADGHFVKVHQMVLSLASPYLKELIKSAPCPHPVLFLNQVSYQTLCSILEYIYSGEVLIDKENLNDLLQAGKALHIKGLEVPEMDIIQMVGVPEVQVTLNMNKESNVQSLQDRKQQQPNVVNLTERNRKQIFIQRGYGNSENSERADVENKSSTRLDDFHKIQRKDMDTSMSNVDDFVGDSFEVSLDDHSKTMSLPQKNANFTSNIRSPPSIQYTLSNQGNIQMILNRYVYYLRYNYKKGDSCRLWRCVDHIRGGKCKATVTTKNDIVVQRVSAHNHTFHDKRIMKKLKSGNIFTAIKDAEGKGHQLASRDGRETKERDDPLKN